MPRTSVLKYCYHKDSGQAVIYTASRTYYLGKYRSKASRIKYAQILSKWAEGGLQNQEPTEFTVSELLVCYLKFARQYYRKNGKITGQVAIIKAAARELRKLYGYLPVRDFGSPQLAGFRDHLITAPSRKGDCEPLARTEINRRVRVVRKIFAWGLEKKYTAPIQVAELKNVQPLLQGRSKARETTPVRPVSDSDVDRTIPFLPPMIADIVTLNRRTSARPSEILSIRWCDIDTSGDTWLFRPRDHKNSHLEGKDCVIAIGSVGQAVLEKYRDIDPESYIFSPARAEGVRHAKRASTRRTPLNHGNTAGSNRKANPKRQPGECYTAASYRRAIERACKKAKIEVWTPYQLRHAYLTTVCDVYGIEAASRAANHSSTAVTRKVYTITSKSAIMEVARALG